VLGVVPLNIEFLETLTGNKWNIWLHSVQRFILATLSPERERLADLMNGHTRFLHKYISLEVKGTAEDKGLNAVPI
jgi:hypothetical protein